MRKEGYMAVAFTLILIAFYVGLFIGESRNVDEVAVLERSLEYCYDSDTPQCIALKLKWGILCNYGLYQDERW